MSQNDCKKRTLLTSFEVIDNNTGAYSQRKDIIEFPKTVTFEYKYVIAHSERIACLNPKLRGFLNILSDHIEWQSQRLADIKPGMSKPRNLLQKDFASIFYLGIKQTNRIITKLKEHKAIFKINGAYYMNPTFYQRGSSIFTENIEHMIDKDPEMKKYLSIPSKRKLNHFLKLDSYF